MEILEYPEAEVPAPLRAQVWALQEQAWPTGGADPGTSHDPALDPRSVLLVDGSAVVAALDLLGKELEHGGEVFAARGFSAVVTDPGRRGRGHGLALVTAARARISALGADLGLFTCDRPLIGFYERAGWEVLPGAVLIGGTPEEPFPSDRPGFDKAVLAGFFSAPVRARRHGFDRARIALHPGTVDRLW